MKKIWIISMMVIITFAFLLERSLGQGYCVVCVDPGHGGPGASKYGPNGDGHGTCGPVLHLSEQWVNLQVGLELEDLIIYGTMFPVIMTRWTEQAENLPPDYEDQLWARCNIANYGNVGWSRHTVYFRSPQWLHALSWDTGDRGLVEFASFDR